MGDLSALKTSITVKVNNRLTISKDFEMDIDAFGTIKKAVDDGDNHIIGLQPLDAGAVRLLMIAADSYSDKVIYKGVKSNGTNTAPKSEEYKLNQLGLFIGDTVKAAANGGPKYLKFTNTSGEAVKIEIFVARSATNA